MRRFWLYWCQITAAWGSQQMALWWGKNSGDWAWLSAKPLPLAVLNRSLWQAAVPSLNFYTLLSLSAVIATLGLLANSAATIIGAMIVAPMMGPIIAIAYGTISGNRRMLRRSGLTLVTGILLTVTVAYGISYFVGLNTVGSEVTARIRPNLLDLGVALAAGTAGAFAKSRRSVADALPGVAIAVALVPPLSVVGIGLAQGSRSISFGALLLFITNLIGIIFSGGLVFLLQRYGSLTRAKGGLALGFVLMVILAVPLGWSLQVLITQQRVRDSIETLIRRRTLTFSNSDIQDLTVTRDTKALLVNLEVTAPAGSISEAQVNLVRDFLAQELARPIDLRVRVIPVQEFQAAPDF